MTALALLGAFYLRFEEAEFAARLPLLVKFLPYFLILAACAYFVLRVTQGKWRFVSLPDLFAIVQATAVLCVVLLAVDYNLLANDMLGTYFLGRKTIIIYGFLQVAFLAAPRFVYRYFRYTRTRTRARNAEAQAVLLIGNAADSELMLRAIESGAVRNIWPVGILSSSPADRGRFVRGIPVLGYVSDLEDAVGSLSNSGRKVERLILTPSAFTTETLPGSLLVRARKLGLLVNRIPSLAQGDQPRLAPVAVEDLLLRPATKIDYDQLRKFITGKAVVVTGGGGSIGSEICDRVVALGASRLLILENSEPALHSVLEKLSSRNATDTAIEGRIADIRESDRMLRLIGAFHPDIVFHAAALKHVPILERDWTEGVRTNVIGSVNVADATVAAGAAALVMISTDKAIEPVSMLGVTKRIAEMYCQALDRELAQKNDAARTRIISVRFGNVLASNGSVVPKFKAQIDAGGPVTVTHPDMVRYFMTIREACDLVIAASNYALTTREKTDVSVFVLNMGQPVRIVELAERMIRLSGLEPDVDISIVFTGTRPGERLNEILFAKEEPTTSIGVSGIMAAKPIAPEMRTLRTWISQLATAADEDDRRSLQTILEQIAPSLGSPGANLDVINS